MNLREYLERAWALCSPDHTAGSPLPETILEDPERENEVLEAERELARVKTLTVEDVAAEMEANAVANAAFLADYDQRKATLKQRYNTLIDAVESWDPAADAADFREMALLHAFESREFDCPTGGATTGPVPTPEWWLADKLATAERAVDRTKNALVRHRGSVRQANAVLAAIRSVSGDDAPLAGTEA